MRVHLQRIHSLLLRRQSHFSTSAAYPWLSHSTQGRRDDDSSRNVSVPVWWNFENCELPPAINVFRVSQAITTAIRANGIKGPVQITAFGNVFQLQREYQEALSSTGINFTHVPSCGNNSADRSLLLNLMCWVSHNPPPAHLFLISGDNDLASTLYRLRMQNYNILLASPEKASKVLCDVASVMWDWHDLLRGVNLTGKHFNQPPDGPYSSWHGQKQVLLVDPFLDVKQSSYSEPGSVRKLSPIPKAVVKNIKKVLDSHPKGLSLAELRSKLSKSHILLDREFYGYKKFSCFILAMPHILKLQQAGDGHLRVHSVTAKYHDPNKCNQDMHLVPADDSEEWDPYLPSELNSDDKFVNESQTSKILFPSSPEKLSVHSSSDLTATVALEKAEHHQDVKTVEMVNTADSDHNEVARDSTCQLSFFKKVWMKWFGSSNCGPNHKNQENGCSSNGGTRNRSHTIPEKHITNKNSFARGEEVEVYFESTRNAAEPPPSSSYHNELALDKKNSPCTEANKTNGHSCDNSNVTVNPSGEHELFPKDSFWSEVESFMATPKGSCLVSESKTREQMAHNLLMEEPFKFMSISKNDLLHLVDLLRSKKKWVEECPSQVLPFKCNHIERDSPVSDGLGTLSQSDMERSTENAGRESSQSTQLAEFSPLDTNKKLQVRTRTEKLADCQKLVKQILIEHPEGYNLGLFRRQFHERYGYDLCPWTLGYKKLGNLFERMPGVKIESGHIIPSDKAPNIISLDNIVTDQQANDNCTITTSDSELSDASRKDDNSDSVCKDSGTEVLKKRAIEATETDMDLDQPFISGDVFPCSEGETPPLTESSGHQTAKVGNGEALHLQMVELLYSSKDKSENVDGMIDCSTNVAKLSALFKVGTKVQTCSEGETPPLTESSGHQTAKVGNGEALRLQMVELLYSGKDKSENVDGMIDCSTNDAKLSALFKVDTKVQTSLGNHGMKKRPLRSCSLVSDPVSDNKDKLIDGILGSLRTSSESKTMQG